MAEEYLKSICIGKSCGWNSFAGTIGCSTGDGSCLVSEFVTASDSDFYDADLRDATQKIQNVLSNVRQRADRKLALLNTPFGVLLAWVQHDVPVPSNSVTINNSPEEIIKALGLVGVGPEDVAA